MNEFERRFLDVAQNSAYLASALRQDAKVVGIDYFAYNKRLGTVAVPLANNSVTTDTIQIQSDSDFVLSYISASTLDAAGAIMANGSSALLQLTDTGSGKTFYSEATQFGLVTGSNGFPFLLPAPRRISPNVNIKIDFTNLQGAALGGFFLSLHGARVYYAG